MDKILSLGSLSLVYWGVGQGSYTEIWSICFSFVQWPHFHRSGWINQEVCVCLCVCCALFLLIHDPLEFLERYKSVFMYFEEERTWHRGENHGKRCLDLIKKKNTHWILINWFLSTYMTKCQYSSRTKNSSNFIQQSWDIIEKLILKDRNTQ